MMICFVFLSWCGCLDLVALIFSSFVYFISIKVSLAAQALSNSVAVALRTLRDLKEYAVFQDCEATAEFIEVIKQEICITIQSHFQIFYCSYEHLSD